MNESEEGTDIEPQVRNIYLWGVLLISLMGGWLAFYSTSLTYHLMLNKFSAPSGCSVNEWMNCDAVLLTRYSKMFGIPVAWFGFLYYVFTIFLVLHALFAKVKKQSSVSASLALIFALAAVLFSLYKATELVKLQVLCPVCVGMYLTNFLILFFLIKYLGFTFKKYGDFFRGFFRSFSGAELKNGGSRLFIIYAIFATWIFIIGFWGVYNFEKNLPKRENINLEKVLAEHFAETKVDLKMSPNAASKGKPGSDVEMVLFSDFECPACRMLSAEMVPLLFEYKNDISFYFINYPLDKSINENVVRNIHPNAAIAAYAGVCAQNQGGFWAYHDSIFRTEEKIDKEYLLHLAGENGLNMEEFENCMNSEETKERIRNEIHAGKEAGIVGTPSLFINGRLVKYWNNPDVISAIIDAELKKN